MKKLFFLFRDLFYLCLGVISRLFFSAKDSQIAIYSFHDLGGVDWRFSHSSENFQKIINIIEQRRVLSKFSQICQEGFSLQRMAVICLDDAYESVFQVRNIFNEKNIPVLLGVIAEPNNVNRGCIENQEQLMSLEQVKIISQIENVEIASHTLTHPFMLKCTPKELKKELADSKNILEKLLGRKVEVLIYPRGEYNEQIINTAKNCHYRYGLSMNDTEIDFKKNAYEIPRIGIDASHHDFVIPYLDAFLNIKFRAYCKSSLRFFRKTSY